MDLNASGRLDLNASGRSESVKIRPFKVFAYTAGCTAMSTSEKAAVLQTVRASYNGAVHPF
jgi:hypothetical protein